MINFFLNNAAPKIKGANPAAPPFSDRDPTNASHSHPVGLLLAYGRCSWSEVQSK